MASMASMATAASSLAHDGHHDYGFGGRGHRLVLVSTIMPALALLLVVNRIFWRLKSGLAPLLMDDWTIMLSLCFDFALAAVNVLSINYGYGRRETSLSSNDIHLALKMFLYDQTFYKFTINLTKLSIVFLYKRIFIEKGFGLKCNLVATLIILYSTASILATVFQCKPTEFAYEAKKNPTQCINLTQFWYANAAYSITTDLIILVLPWLVIWKLKGLNRHAKINLALVLSLGIFVTMTSILRLTTLNLSSKARDQVYGTYISTVWTGIEANAAIIAACIPMLRTLLARIFPQTFSKASYGPRQSSYMQTANDETRAEPEPRISDRNVSVAAARARTNPGPGPVALERIRLGTANSPLLPTVPPRSYYTSAGFPASHPSSCRSSIRRDERVVAGPSGLTSRYPYYDRTNRHYEVMSPYHDA